MKKINTLKIAFAGYDAFNEEVYKTISGQSFKDKTSLDVQISYILVEKNEDKDFVIPFTTDFEYIIYGYFDVLIFGKLYKQPDHKTVSLARQSLTTGKDIIVTDPSLIEIYGSNIQEVADSQGLSVEEAYSIDTVINKMITIASNRAAKTEEKKYGIKISGVDAQ